METLGLVVVCLGELMCSAPIICLIAAGSKSPWMRTSSDVFFSGLLVCLVGLAIAHYGKHSRLAKN